MPKSGTSPLLWMFGLGFTNSSEVAHSEIFSAGVCAFNYGCMPKSVLSIRTVHASSWTSVDWKTFYNSRLVNNQEGLIKAPTVQTSEYLGDRLKWTAVAHNYSAEEWSPRRFERP